MTPRQTESHPNSGDLPNSTSGKADLPSRETASIGKKIQVFFRRHPMLRDALLWALPALVFGAVLRILMMSYLPYGVWGADSRSYFSFAHKLVHNGWFSLGDKRRFLYPLLMAPVAILPGGALRWIPLLQHTAGLLSVLPLAYVVRKTLVAWRVWIAPVTILYSGIPIVLYCEQELLGEHVFFATLICAFAGWVAWVTQEKIARARRMFWWFLVPFALFILTKPAGRLMWPGVFVGLALVGAWRLLTWSQLAVLLQKRWHLESFATLWRMLPDAPARLLTWRQLVALLAVMAVTPFVGSKKQGAWLLYTATFPLTRLDTPLHADYKAEISDLVSQMRSDLGMYYQSEHGEPFYFLRDPGEQDARPLWKQLDKNGNEKLKNKLYMDLALEGVKARPDLWLRLSFARIVCTSNISSFHKGYFADGRYTEDFAKYYKEAADDDSSPIRLALDLPKTGPIPPYESYRAKLEPMPGSFPARAVQGWVNIYADNFNLFRFPELPDAELSISKVRATFLFWWLCLGMLLSLLPAYRRTLGVWTIIATGYVVAVFMISLVNARYFAPAWPIVLIVMAIPGDVALAAIRSRIKARAGALSSVP